VIGNRDKEVYETVAAQLARVEHFRDFSYITTPLLFPYGGGISVRVSRNIDGYLVSDHGIGAEEANLIDGSAYYARIAPRVAAEAGVQYDSHSFFVLQVTEDRLVGAVTTIANCVHEAVFETYKRVEEYKARAASDQLFEKLTAVFDPSSVARDVEIVGASSHKWAFDSAVRLQSGGEALFETVGKHHNAVFSAVTKFHDVGRIELAPMRVAVIGKRVDYGDYLSLLGQAAKVVEMTANDNSYRSIVA